MSSAPRRLLSCSVETDPNKIRELRLKMPRMTSAEFWAQFERNQRDASRMLGIARQKRSEDLRVRED